MQKLTFAKLLSLAAEMDNTGDSLRSIQSIISRHAGHQDNERLAADKRVSEWTYYLADQYSYSIRDMHDQRDVVDKVLLIDSDSNAIDRVPSGFYPYARTSDQPSDSGLNFHEVFLMDFDEMMFFERRTGNFLAADRTNNSGYTLTVELLRALQKNYERISGCLPQLSIAIQASMDVRKEYMVLVGTHLDVRIWEDASRRYYCKFKDVRGLSVFIDAFKDMKFDQKEIDYALDSLTRMLEHSKAQMNGGVPVYEVLVHSNLIEIRMYSAIGPDYQRVMIRK